MSRTQYAKVFRLEAVRRGSDPICSDTVVVCILRNFSTVQSTCKVCFSSKPNSRLRGYVYLLPARHQGILRQRVRKFTADQ